MQGPFVFYRHNKKTTVTEITVDLVEHRGFEPLTSTLPVWRAPGCIGYIPPQTGQKSVQYMGNFVSGFGR